MSISIKGIDYTGFIDYDRAALRKASVETRILRLEYRVKKGIIYPLDQIVPPEAPCHKPVNDGDRTFNLCGVTLVACAIEGLGSDTAFEQGFADGLVVGDVFAGL
jgi:hypothetical protein